MLFRKRVENRYFKEDSSLVMRRTGETGLLRCSAKFVFVSIACDLLVESCRAS
jgi:hypothetical protein